MRRCLLVVLACLASRVAAAAPCAQCSKGDALVAHYHLEPLRELAGQLQSLNLGETLTTAQYAQLVDLRRRTPALVAAGALADDDLGAVAASLCSAATGTCVDAIRQSLRCAADRCAVDLPAPDKNADVIEIPTACREYAVKQRSPWFGVGFDWGNGVQRSRFPHDGGAWSFGIEGRARLGPRLGAVVRFDRIAGRDEAHDNGKGNDDVSTGSITRLAALAGPSIVLDNARWESTTRSLRLDLLGGWLSTRSQPGETGPVAGADLALQLSIVRFGVRVLQGMGDASSATMLLAHFDLMAGSAPLRDDSTNCASTPRRSSRLALGLDFPLGGAGIADKLGYLGTGIAVEPIWHLTPSFDAVTRLDLLLFPGQDRDRVIHQAALAGIRMDHGDRRSNKVGFYTMLLGGYTHSAGLTPTTTGSGPVVDLAFGWGGQDADGAASFRLHGRFGVGPDNLDYRVIFLSAGFELRFDPHSWANRF